MALYKPTDTKLPYPRGPLSKAILSRLLTRASALVSRASLRVRLARETTSAPANAKKRSVHKDHTGVGGRLDPLDGWMGVQLFYIGAMDPGVQFVGGPTILRHWNRNRKASSRAWRSCSLVYSYNYPLLRKAISGCYRNPWSAKVTSAKCLSLKNLAYTLLSVSGKMTLREHSLN